MDATIGAGSAANAVGRPVNVMTSPDIELVNSDFEAMYLREYPAMIAVATVLSGYDGEDLVHDAFVKAFVRWDVVQRLERPGGWCHRVLVNMCRGRWRRRRTHERWLARQPRRQPSTPEPSAATIAFWEAVRRLPERPRAVVTLYYAGDHPVAHIARIIGSPEGTVRSDLTRARALLARELGGDHG
jgi:RNA polymerase sigma-70 factor (ECF subfamily)